MRATRDVAPTGGDVRVGDARPCALDASAQRRPTGRRSTLHDATVFSSCLSLVCIVSSVYGS